MERLRGVDFRVANVFQQEIYAFADVASLKSRLMTSLPAVVRADSIMYMESDLLTKRTSGLVDPPDLVTADHLRTYAQFVRESPLLKAYKRGKGSAVKYSDFLTQREFRRTALYNEFFRPIGIEYRIAKGLPGPPGLVTAVYLDRRRGARDFGERDRLLLNLLRPHLNQAYQNAVAVTRMRREIDLFEHGVEGAESGLVLLTSDGEPPILTTRASEWLTKYFGASRKGGTHLPAALERWLAFQDRRVPGGIPAPSAPLVVEQAATRLLLRLIVKDDRRLLLLQEEDRTRTSIRAKPLEALGLTPREAEVLAWVAEGKTSGDAATILGASRRTIEKHLEHIYVKLGVETRTAAAAQALAVLSANGGAARARPS